MRSRDPIALAEAVLAGDRSALPRLLSAVERGGPGAREIGRRLYAKGGQALTVGLTGPPGAGKSTLADRMIRALRARGEDVAVLAVDPTSPYTGGALLGDRVRMMDHALDAGVFVRSMATRGHFGGLSLAAPEMIRALDAAGFPTILVETVGVGQIEVEIAGAADTTVVVINPGSGDSVQANKAGLLEVADIFVINKADRPGTAELERDLSFMLDLTEASATKPVAWRPPIVRVVAAKGVGVDDTLEAIGRHRVYSEESGELARRRDARAADELREIVTQRLTHRATQLLGDEHAAVLLGEVRDRRRDPWSAADELLRAFDA